MVDSSPVSIDTINQNTNSGLGRNNDIASGAPIDTEMDGLTTVLICTAQVTPNGDEVDEARDRRRRVRGGGSNVFIAAGSLTTSTTPGAPTTCPPSPATRRDRVVESTGFIGARARSTPTRSPVPPPGTPRSRAAQSTDGQTMSVSVGGLTNGTEYTCVVAAHNADGFGADSDPSNAVTPSDANASFVVDSSAGRAELTPTVSDLGTSGRIVLPPQGGTRTTSSLARSCSVSREPGMRRAADTAASARASTGP